MGNYRFFHGFFNVSIWIKTTKIEHLVCNCSFLFAAHNGVHHIHSVHLSSLELHLQILGIHKLENLWLAWPHSIGLRMQGKKTRNPQLSWLDLLFVFLPFLFLMMCEVPVRPLFFFSERIAVEFSSKTSGWNLCQRHELQTLSRATTPAWAQRGLLGLGDEFFRDYHWVVKVITGLWNPTYIYIY